MSRFVMAITLFALWPKFNIAQTTSEPVHVSGDVVSKLEKQTTGINSRFLPPRQAATGTVRLEFTVKTDGTVSDIKTVEEYRGTVKKALSQAAAASLSQWTYNPYVVNGQPSPMRATIEFKFEEGRSEHTYP